MILFRVVLCKHSELTKMNQLRCTIKSPQRYVVRSLRRSRQGERLPPALDLATYWREQEHVIRALHILRTKTLDFTRGRGVRVVGTPQRGAVMTRIDELLTFARTQDIDEMSRRLIQARS